MIGTYNPSCPLYFTISVFVYCHLSLLSFIYLFKNVLLYFLTIFIVCADGSSAAQVDIITEQPRSSQHTLQPGDSVDLSASSDQGGGGGTSASGTPESPNDNEEEMLSRSSSGGANVTPETADSTIPENATPEGGPLAEGGTLLGTNDRSLPPSDSSQTTTEGPDSAVTPSDVAELVRVTQPDYIVLCIVCVFLC